MPFFRDKGHDLQAVPVPDEQGGQPFRPVHLCRDPGGTYNVAGNLPDDTPRQMLRNGGWNEQQRRGAEPGVLGAVLQGGVSAGLAGAFTRKEASGPAIDHTFTDLPNEALTGVWGCDQWKL